MKFLKFSLVLLVFASAGFFYSCSKDDSPSTEEVGEIVTPSEIRQGQVVSIEMPNAVPAQQYTGTLGGNTIQVVRSGENVVMFRVPVTLLGETDLVVSDLGLDLHYNVNETVLTATPQQELAPLFTDVADFSESISNEQSEEADIVNQYVDSFNAYYNTLTDAEKEQLAIIYKANSELFNGIIAGDLTAGRPMDINFNIDTQLLKHKLAVLALGGGVTFVILAPDPLEKSLGALVAVIAWKKAKGYLNDFMSAKLRKLNVLFQGVTGDLNRGNMENLTFTSGEAKSFSFDVQGRDIASGDESSSTGGLTTFFNSHGIFTGAVTNLNNAIEFVNDNLFFSNISLIPVYTMPSDQPTEVQDGDSTFFDAMQLSVASSNVTMSNVSFANGNISMKLTIDNPDAVSGESLSTTINYSYQDELNSFSGSFPVEIFKEEQFNYELRIGDYNPDYNLIQTQMTLQQGDAVTLGNYTEQMVGLLLDGEPVAVGGNSFPWTTVTFGDVPVSAEPVVMDDYTFSVYDATNQRSVSFTLDLTLTNNAYANLVGATITVNGNVAVTFNANGTYSSVSTEDGSTGPSGSYTWLPTGAYPWVDCTPYGGEVITSMVAGGVNAPGIAANYVIIYEDGHFSANSTYACEGFTGYIPME